jgi:hypothetical protein
VKLTLEPDVAGFRGNARPLENSMDEAKQKTGWKQRALREFVRYWMNVVYLAIIFGLFAWYRRLILAAYDISYLKYGVAVIEALVLAKVVMIGDLLHLGREFKDKPLIYPALFNSVIFTLFVALFSFVEGMVSGVLKGKGAMAGLVEVFGRDKYEVLARCLIVFVMFIPFFAVRELGKVFGEGKLGKLFFRSRSAAAV